MPQDSIRQRFDDIWPTHTRAFADLLTEARRCFDGDLDSLLILTVIGSRTMANWKAMGMDYERFRKGESVESNLASFINTQSVSDVTGIPRETTRRKIKEMIERGWVEDTAAGLVATRRCATDLESLTEETFRYLDQILACIASIRK